MKIYFFLFLITFPTYFAQQIFNDNYSTCKYTYTNKNLSKSHFNIENKVWNIIGEGSYKNVHVKLSPCETLRSEKCDHNACVCVLAKDYNINVPNAGEHFIYTKTDDGKNILKSVNGQKCDKTENFTVIIEFESHPEVPVYPTIVFLNQCFLRLKMILPSYSPPCTIKDNGNIIDMRPLKKMQTIVLQESRNKSYALSICSESKKCCESISALSNCSESKKHSKSISVCEIVNGIVSSALSDVDSQQVYYDVRKGVIIKGHYGEKHSQKIMELHLQCNWNIKEVDKIVLENPNVNTKKFKFKGESSLACIKLPKNCLIRDKMKPYLLYDLRTLNKNYEVFNVSNGKITVNLCDTLNSFSEKNKCIDQYSQVCYESNTKEIHNLGSISTGFDVTSSDTVVGSFQDGSVCSTNSSLTYSTNIELICSSVQEPFLESIDGCVYKIKWFTPAACPVNNPQNTNCVLYDLAGSVDLNSMHIGDRLFAFSTNSRLRYNLCGPLTQPCNGNSIAGACYIEDEKESVVGISNSTLFIEDNLITMKMSGKNCQHKMSYTKVVFHCKYLLFNEEQIKVKISHDKCEFIITVYTPLVCGSIVQSNCNFNNRNVMYNLNLISRNTTDYQIKFNNNLYILNMCRSLMRTTDILCPPNTAICMKNLSEPHLKKKYTSLGIIHKNIVPKFKNMSLVFTFDQGGYCSESESLMRTSTITLECSDVEEGPQLLREQICNHDFIWRSPHACPILNSHRQLKHIVKSCRYISSHNHRSIDLSIINRNISIIIKGKTFEFTLCSNIYSECIGNLCTRKTAKLEFLNNSTVSYLHYEFDHNCFNNLNPNQLFLYLICDPVLDYEYKVVNKSNCIVQVYLKTNLACSSEVLPSAFTNDSFCSRDEKHEYFVKSLKNYKVISSFGKMYILNFENLEPSCKGVLCKDDLTVISKDYGICSNVNIEKSLVHLKFQSKKLLCKNFTNIFSMDVELYCSLENENPVIIEELDCKISIQYHVKEICSIFGLPTLTARSSSVIIGVSIASAVVIISVLVGIWLYKKYRCSYHELSDKCRTHVYIRNTSL